MEYQQTIQELGCIQQTFLEVSQMRASDVLSQATINAASHIVISSMELIGDFLERTKKYRHRFCAGVKSSMAMDGWHKIGWALFKSEEMKLLRDSLHYKLTAIGVLLSTARFHGNTFGTISQFEVSTFGAPKALSGQSNSADQKDGTRDTRSDTRSQRLDVELPTYDNTVIQAALPQASEVCENISNERPYLTGQDTPKPVSQSSAYEAAVNRTLEEKFERLETVLLSQKEAKDKKGNEGMHIGVVEKLGRLEKLLLTKSDVREWEHKRGKDNEDVKLISRLHEFGLYPGAH